MDKELRSQFKRFITFCHMCEEKELNIEATNKCEKCISEAISQIKALVIESLGEEKCYFKRDFTRVRDYEDSKMQETGYNQHIAEMKEKWSLEKGER